MKKADLHVHSKYSGHPSEWLLNKLGVNESYTEPEAVYRSAIARGMDYVTITDHNEIKAAVFLREKYGDRIIIGCESTAYFPEDGCKIHILSYDIDELQFKKIQSRRENIYSLRDYLKTEGIAHSVAHATYDVNNKLTLAHLERLTLLFDVFEGINGARNKLFNETWHKFLKGLTPEIIERLYLEHKIEPFSSDPWVKGFTGGSDDHAGLFIGRTCTVADANNRKEFINAIREKKSTPEGRFNDYRDFAFIIYKVLFDYTKSKGNTGNNLVLQLSELFYEKKNLSLLDSIKFKHLQLKRKKESDEVRKSIFELIELLRNNKDNNIDKKIDLAFGKITDVSDFLVKEFAKAFEADIKSGDFVKLMRTLASAFPAVFLAAPFFTTLTQMHKRKDLLDALLEKHNPHKASKPKKILWFTDTLNDMNGVSVTLRKLACLSGKNGFELKMVCSEPKGNDFGGNIINLPYVCELEIPAYEKATVRIPSFLRSIEILHEYSPDEIYISTPGPVGLFGLAFSKLTGVKTTGVYHTDFAAQAKSLTSTDGLGDVVEMFTKWFYSAMDKILVPTQRYKEILEKRGFEPKKISLFIRGVDTEMFTPEKTSMFRRKFEWEKKGFTLLYTGRISPDKNIEFLADVYRHLNQYYNDISLVLAGEGPYVNDLKSQLSIYNNVHFLGRLKNEELPEIYRSADLFLFPSVTDTFGMSVLEAQACGLPALVTDVGGPREIIKDGLTGFVLKLNVMDWVENIKDLKTMKEKDPEKFNTLKERSRANVIMNYSWEKALNNIFYIRPTKKENNLPEVKQTCLEPGL